MWLVMLNNMDYVFGSIVVRPCICMRAKVTIYFDSCTFTVFQIDNVLRTVHLFRSRLCLFLLSFAHRTEYCFIATKNLFEFGVFGYVLCCWCFFFALSFSFRFIYHVQYTNSAFEWEKKQSHFPKQNILILASNFSFMSSMYCIAMNKRVPMSGQDRRQTRQTAHKTKYKTIDKLFANPKMFTFDTLKVSSHFTYHIESDAIPFWPQHKTTLSHHSSIYLTFVWFGFRIYCKRINPDCAIEKCISFICLWA